MVTELVKFIVTPVGSEGADKRAYDAAYGREVGSGVARTWPDGAKR